MALKFASLEMIKEASLTGALWGGLRGAAGAVGKATGVTPLAKGIQGGMKATDEVAGAAAKQLRSTGIRRLAGTAIGTGVVAAGVSGAQNAKKTQAVRQQRYGNIDPRFRRPNPAKGHSQTGLY